MRVTDLLKKEGVVLNAAPASRDEAFDILIDLQAKLGNISDKEEYKKGIFEREAQCTTAIGEGLAIPHAKNKAVTKPGLVAITVPGGVNCNSMDNAPTNLIFMIAAPETGGDVHLEVLANLNKMLMDAAFRAKLLSAKTPEEFLKVVDEKETQKLAQNVSASGYRILAVTACPTGIAHTFMAAEALELKGKEMGYALKAETNGSEGAKNVLTKEEIAKADGIIIAADKNVEMARFDGKRVLKVKVSDGIHRPQELIEKVIKGDVPVYHHEGGSAEEAGEGEGVGHQIYKHLMNGVSHMLPFVIGGGILIALAFLLDTVILGNNIVPKTLGSTTSWAQLFMNIGGTAFGFMLPVLAGYIAMSIADRPGLAVGFVGGAIAKAGASISFTGGALVVTSTGVSPGFLGALIAGFLGGFIVLALKKVCGGIPRSIEGIKPILIYPVAGLFLVGIIMLFINPYVGNINTAMTNGLNSLSGGNKILLGIIVAGMMSVDMGGPINKAAYVFGTATIVDVAGNSVASPVMAAVMVGGMVPPLVIALSTTFFRNKWTKQQRESGFVNYFMGLCFISEGAIPFAAADPIRVIPSCIVGSAVAGAISMAMNCTLMAPHGGVFVFGLVDNAFGYLIALAVGSIVGAIILTSLKKPIENNK